MVPSPKKSQPGPDCPNTLLGLRNPCPKKKERKPWADTGNSVGWFCCYHRLILINFWNYNRNLSYVPLSWKICCLCWIFVNYCQPQKRPTIWIWVQSLENLVIATPNTDFWYQRTVQSWIVSIPSPTTLFHMSFAFVKTWSNSLQCMLQCIAVYCHLSLTYTHTNIDMDKMERTSDNFHHHTTHTHFCVAVCCSVCCSVLRCVTTSLSHTHTIIDMDTSWIKDGSQLVQMPLWFYAAFTESWQLEQFVIDWCCFYYFVKNSLVALLEALWSYLNLKVFNLGLQVLLRKFFCFIVDFLPYLSTTELYFWVTDPVCNLFFDSTIASSLPKYSFLTALEKYNHFHTSAVPFVSVWSLVSEALPRPRLFFASGKDLRFIHALVFRSFH